LTALRLDATADSDRVDEWVNLAYQDVIQATGALQTTAVATLTSGDASYTIPAIVAEINLVVVTYSDGTVSAPIQRVTLEQILTNRRTNLAVGQQLWNPLYAIVGQNQIELWPTPGAGQSLTFWYSGLPDALVADGDQALIQEPFGSKVLEYGALVEGARFLKDPLLQDYEAAYQGWLAKFQVWLNRRQGETSLAFRVRSNADIGNNLVGLARDVG
jgi:hypothetical protein